MNKLLTAIAAIFFCITALNSCKPVNARFEQAVKQDKDRLKKFEEMLEYTGPGSSAVKQLLKFDSSFIKNCDYYEYILFDSMGAFTDISTSDSAMFFEKHTDSLDKFKQDNASSIAWHKPNQNYLFAIDVYKRPKAMKHIGCDFFTRITINAAEKRTGFSTSSRRLLILKRGYN